METQRIETVKLGERVVIEFARAPSANKQDGVTVKIHGDDLEAVKKEAKETYEWAIEQLKPFPAPAVKEK